MIILYRKIHSFHFCSRTENSKSVSNCNLCKMIFFLNIYRFELDCITCRIALFVRMVSFPRVRVTVTARDFTLDPTVLLIWSLHDKPIMRCAICFVYVKTMPTSFMISKNTYFRQDEWDLLFEARVPSNGLGNDLDLFFRSQTSVPTGSCLDMGMPCFL